MMCKLKRAETRTGENNADMTVVNGEGFPEGSSMCDN